MSLASCVYSFVLAFYTILNCTYAGIFIFMKVIILVSVITVVQAHKQAMMQRMRRLEWEIVNLQTSGIANFHARLDEVGDLSCYLGFSVSYEVLIAWLLEMIFLTCVYRFVDGGTSCQV